MTTTIDAAPRHKIVESSLANGGGTFWADGTPVQHGTAVTLALLDKVSQGDLPLAIYNFESQIPEGNFLGTWYDEENGVWEISETAVYRDREVALIVARGLGERYVFDIDAQECVAVG